MLSYHMGMIALTDKAAENVKRLAADDAEAKVLRVAVEGGGCSGFQYAIGFDTGAEPDDLEIETHGVRVVVDPISLPYLAGSTIDYSDGLIGAGFKFDNPNVASSCGCNSSFQAKEGIEGPYSPKDGGGCGPS
jgi:iron-sulfur cluster assembly accessory protein